MELDVGGGDKFSSPFHGEVSAQRTEGPVKPEFGADAPPLRPDAAHRPTSSSNGEERHCFSPERRGFMGLRIPSSPALFPDQDELRLAKRAAC
jgi:hypothetical protein